VWCVRWEGVWGVWGVLWVVCVDVQCSLLVTWTINAWCCCVWQGLIIYNGPQCGNTTYGDQWPLEMSLYWDQGWGSGEMGVIGTVDQQWLVLCTWL
jgi:hypothetical protein